MSLRAKFCLVFSGLVVGTLILFMATLLAVENRSAILQMRRGAFKNLQEVVVVCRESHLKSDWIGALNRLKLERKNPQVLRADCYDKEGIVRASSDADRIGTRPLAPEELEKVFIKPLLITRMGPEEAEEWNVTFPVKIGSETIGAARMVFDLVFLQEQIRSELAALFSRLVRGSTVTLLLAILIALALAWSLTKPIRSLVDATKELKAGRLGTQSHVGGRHDELGELARRFDEMSKSLAELEKMRKQFIDGITHDLKSPLMVIMSYLDLFVDTKAEQFNEKELRQLKMAQSSSQRLRDYIQNMLDYSKIGAGKPLPMKIKEIDLQGLFAGVIQSLEVTANIMELTVNGKVEPGAEKVFGDEEMLRRVLSNLTSNALKFTPVKGTITLSAMPMLEDGSIRIGVKDTGAGIPKEDLLKIFKSFFQVESTRDKAKETGTGLGLSICQQIVQQHGGRIWVESELGKGTVFYFTAPSRTFEPNIKSS